MSSVGRRRSSRSERPQQRPRNQPQPLPQSSSLSSLWRLLRKIPFEKYPTSSSTLMPNHSQTIHCSPNMQTCSPNSRKSPRKPHSKRRRSRKFSGAKTT
ncbi:uncharacterized protein RCC_05882 [Ramularia collo-cygni]|uniref:Uncharacterized protein n=1 Tax=Ramularia collo-cygni TaxID=112498 RepID=A0A2D3UZZ1_9PEZI|nr:uncharacterized protein RCC_05882 [Ramularia collo-cygni]CZT20025.1 uncharacterized protein RCC_05882 [Ramularia collo-cygni]